MMEEEDSDFGGTRGDIELTTDQENGVSSTDDLAKRKKKKTKKVHKKVTIQDDPEKLGSKPRPQRQRSTRLFQNLIGRSSRSNSDDEDGMSSRGCSPFMGRRQRTYFKTELIQYEINTKVKIDQHHGNITISQPTATPSTSTDGATANNPQNNSSIILQVDGSDLLREVLNPHMNNLNSMSRDMLLDLINRLDTSNMRTSMRRRTTRSTRAADTAANDIEADSGTVGGERVGNTNDDDEGVVLEDENSTLNGDELRTMLNTLQNEGRDFEVQPEIHQSDDGEISITWKVLVKKITEHKDGNFAIAIPQVVIIIVLSAIGIIAAMLLLHYLGAFAQL